MFTFTAYNTEWVYVHCCFCNCTLQIYICGVQPYRHIRFILICKTRQISHNCVVAVAVVWCSAFSFFLLFCFYHLPLCLCLPIAPQLQQNLKKKKKSKTRASHIYYSMQRLWNCIALAFGFFILPFQALAMGKFINFWMKTHATNLVLQYRLPKSSEKTQPKWKRAWDWQNKATTSKKRKRTKPSLFSYWNGENSKQVTCNICVVQLSNRLLVVLVYCVYDAMRNCHQRKLFCYFVCCTKRVWRVWCEY